MDHRRREWTGVTSNGLTSYDGPKSVHGQAGHCKRAMAPACHAQTDPRPSAPPGMRPRCLPPLPSCHKRDIPRDEPTALSGRAIGNRTTSGPVRECSSRTRRHEPPVGGGRVSPNTCWVQPPIVRTAHRGAIATTRRKRTSSPPRRLPPFVVITKAVDRSIFSLDFRNLIRVRL